MFTKIKRHTAVGTVALNSNVITLIEVGDNLTLVHSDGTLTDVIIRPRENSGLLPTYELVFVGKTAETVVASGLQDQVQAIKRALVRDYKTTHALTMAGKIVPSLSAIVCAVVVAFFASGYYHPPSSNPPSQAALEEMRILRAQLDALRAAPQRPVVVPGVSAAVPPLSPPMSNQVSPPAGLPSQTAVPVPTQIPGLTRPSGVAVNLDDGASLSVAPPSPPSQQAAPSAPPVIALSPAFRQSSQSLEEATHSSTDKEKYVSALGEILKAVQSGQTVTPEMLNGLPPDVAAKISSQISGLVSSRSVLSPSGELPPEAYDEAPKDVYGIARIPDHDVWRQGGIRLPPPGGGDVKKMDDLKKFGLNPG